MTHIDTVRKIYRDFAAGDAAAILDVFADDVEFRLAEHHPYRGSAGAWRGRQAIAQEFFAVAGPEWQSWTIGVVWEINPPWSLALYQTLAFDGMPSAYVVWPSPSAV